MDSRVEMIIENAQGKWRPWGGVDHLTKTICAARDGGTRGKGREDTRGPARGGQRLKGGRGKWLDHEFRNADEKKTLTYPLNDSL